jgi:hypothetical protein
MKHSLCIVVLLFGCKPSAAPENGPEWKRSRAKYCQEIEHEQHEVLGSLDEFKQMLDRQSTEAQPSVMDCVEARAQITRIDERVRGLKKVGYMLLAGGNYQTPEAVGIIPEHDFGSAALQELRHQPKCPAQNESLQALALQTAQAKPKVEKAFAEALKACHGVGWRSALKDSKYK